MKKVVLLGIGGTGMSALAGLFVQQGWQVEGTDGPLYPPVDGMLADLGVVVREGYGADQLPDADIYVVGNAISRGNPQLELLLSQDRPFLSMASALRRFFLEGRPRVVVAGTHGKTSTTAWLAHLLEAGGLSPGYFIGGQPLSLPRSSAPGAGRAPFILEGDEYESCFHERYSKFYKYHPRYLVLGACEYDHADFFETPQAYRKAFCNLVDQIPENGWMALHTGIRDWQALASRCRGRVITYGQDPDSDWYLEEVVASAEGQHLRWRAPRDQGGHLALPIWGRHNALNVLAGLVLAGPLGVPSSLWAEAAASFTGVRRRLQVLARRGEVLWVEDFAHHPTAIRAAVAAAREHRPQAAVHVIFEPGSATLRMNTFAEEVVMALGEADETWVYAPHPPAGRPPLLEPEKLVNDLGARGCSSTLFREADPLWRAVREQEWERAVTVLLLSNGRLGGLAGHVRNAWGTPQG